MLEETLEVRATCHGASPEPAFVPPTILVKFPFLIKSSLLRDPEQEVQTEKKDWIQVLLETNTWTHYHSHN